MSPTLTVLGNVVKSQPTTGRLRATLSFDNVETMAKAKAARGRKVSPEHEREMAALGRRLGRALEARGMGPVQLDEAVGGSKGTATKLVGGDRPQGVNPLYLRSAAKVLRISLYWLLSEEGPMDQEEADRAIGGRFVVEKDNLEIAVDYQPGAFDPKLVAAVRFEHRGEINRRTPEQWTELLEAAAKLKRV